MSAKRSSSWGLDDIPRKRRSARIAKQKQRSSCESNIFFLPGEILCKIFEFATRTRYKETSLQIRLTCKRFDSFMNLAFNPFDPKNIVKQLHFFSPVIASSLPAFLLHNGFVLGGSFPLQCVTRTSFEDSDVDIFIKAKETQHKESMQRLIKSRIICRCRKCYAMIRILTKSTRHETLEYEESTLSTLLLSISNHMEQQKKFQFIRMDCAKDDSLLEKLQDEFDLEFCKVFYDGNKVHIHESAFERSGNWTIVKRGDIFDPSISSRRLKRTLDRFGKYEKRGFHIKNQFTNGELSKLDDSLRIIEQLSFAEDSPYPRSLKRRMKRNLLEHFVEAHNAVILKTT